MNKDIRDKISELRRKESSLNLDCPKRNDSIGIKENGFYQRNDEQYSLFPTASKLLTDSDTILK